MISTGVTAPLNKFNIVPLIPKGRAKRHSVGYFPPLTSTQEPPPSPFWQLTRTMVWVLPGRKLGPWSEFPFLYRFTVLLNSGGSNSPWSEFWSEFPHFMGMGVVQWKLLETIINSRESGPDPRKTSVIFQKLIRCETFFTKYLTDLRFLVPTVIWEGAFCKALEEILHKVHFEFSVVWRVWFQLPPLGNILKGLVWIGFLGSISIFRDVSAFFQCYASHLILHLGRCQNCT